MAAARADYRMKSRYGVTSKECVDDARMAMRWFRQNAAKLGIDPDNIVASGAGGYDDWRVVRLVARGRVRRRKGQVGSILFSVQEQRTIGHMAASPSFAPRTPPHVLPN